MLLLQNQDGFVFPLSDDHLERYAALGKDGMTIEEAIREHEQRGERFVGPEALLPPGYLEALRAREKDIERQHSEVIDRIDKLDAEAIKPLEERIVAKLDCMQKAPRSDPDRLSPEVSHGPSENVVLPGSIRELMMCRGVLPDKEWFTVKEAAKVLGKSEWQLRNKWCRLGRIRCKREADRTYRIPLAGLIEVLNHGLRPVGTYKVE